MHAGFHQGSANCLLISILGLNVQQCAPYAFRAIMRPRKKDFHAHALYICTAVVYINALVRIYPTFALFAHQIRSIYKWPEFDMQTPRSHLHQSQQKAQANVRICSPIVAHFSYSCSLLFITFGFHIITRYHMVPLHITHPPEFESLHLRVKHPDFRMLFLFHTKQRLRKIAEALSYYASISLLYFSSSAWLP